MAIARLGLIGDVHAEDQLLEAALETFARRRVDTVLCVGDIVDGQGSVDRCCELLSRVGAIVVRGNHERWLFEDVMRDLPNATTRESLRPDTLAYLAALPATREIDTVRGKILLCHGMGDDDMHGLKPHDAGYAIEVHDALQAVLRSRRHSLVIAGHTHERMVRELGGITFVNAGTLHRDWPATLGVIDLAAEPIEIVLEDLER